MQKKIIGIILASMGTGMLIVTFLPWWGFAAATVMVVSGCLLIFGKWCWEHKKTLRLWAESLLVFSDGASNFTWTHTSCANVNWSDSSIVVDFNFFNIRLPGFVGTTAYLASVYADSVACLLGFCTNFTFCHYFAPPWVSYKSYLSYKILNMNTTKLFYQKWAGIASEIK